MNDIITNSNKGTLLLTDYNRSSLWAIQKHIHFVLLKICFLSQFGFSQTLAPVCQVPPRKGMWKYEGSMVQFLRSFMFIQNHELSKKAHSCPNTSCLNTHALVFVQNQSCHWGQADQVSVKHLAVPHASSLSAAQWSSDKSMCIRRHTELYYNCSVFRLSC